jgi:hypothetical protein
VRTSELGITEFGWKSLALRKALAEVGQHAHGWQTMDSRLRLNPVMRLFELPVRQQS